MVILDKSLTTTELTKEEAVYLQILDEHGDADYEMEYKLVVMFGLDETVSSYKVKAYLDFKNGETV